MSAHPDPPTGKITKDAKGRVVWGYTVEYAEDGRALLSPGAHTDYRPNAFPWTDWWTWDDGREQRVTQASIRKYFGAPDPD